MTRHRHRRLAASVAVLAAVAVAVLLRSQTAFRRGDAGAALWDNAGFLTDLANLLVAVAFGLAALGVHRARLVAQSVTAIALVAVGYWTIGRGWRVFGTVGLGDVLSHGVVPVMAIGVWLAVLRTGTLRWRDLALLIAPLLAYLAWAIGRGVSTGMYPYGWMDLSRIGFAGVAPLLFGHVALGALLAALAIWLDRRAAPPASGAWRAKQ